MSSLIAFVGDIHGCIQPLHSALHFIDKHDYETVVFLGDYIDRGDDSGAVIDCLAARSSDKRFFFLRGNHEAALLQSLRDRDLGTFFCVGGAATIRSYIGNSVNPDVFNTFDNSIPSEHKTFLQHTKNIFKSKTLVAAHQLKDLPNDGRFRIAGHKVIGEFPQITDHYALIDTGCGSGGKLTLLEWPTLRFYQF